MSSRLAWATQQDPVSILEQQQQQRQLWMCLSMSDVETKANTVRMGEHKLKNCVSVNGRKIRGQGRAIPTPTIGACKPILAVLEQI